MGYQFKEGDRVIIKRSGISYDGRVGTIKNINIGYETWTTMGTRYYSLIQFNNSEIVNFYNDTFDLFVRKESVEESNNLTKTNLMTKLNTMMKRLLDADTKKLIKAGLINGDLLLTEQGKEALLAIEVETNKKALLEIADEIIAEEEKK